MEKELMFSELYEEYKGLLTENQSEIFNLYYLCDLSLSEIAEIRGISRQGVNDNLSKAKENLIFYEEKLGLLKKKKELIQIVNNIQDDKLKETLKKKIGEI